MNFSDFQPMVSDPNAVHEIRLDYHRTQGVVSVAVSCQCHKTLHGTSVAYDPIKVLNTNEPPWDAYNDPNNHKGVFRYEDQKGPPEAIRSREAFAALLDQLDGEHAVGEDHSQ